MAVKVGHDMGILARLVKSGPTPAKELAAVQNADSALLGKCGPMCGPGVPVPKASQIVFYALWCLLDTWRSVVPNYMHQVHYRTK
jgi:hypothetical protein